MATLFPGFSPTRPYGVKVMGRGENLGTSLIKWAQERTGRARETREGRGRRLPERPMKIVSRPQSNYLAAAA